MTARHPVTTRRAFLQAAAALAAALPFGAYAQSGTKLKIGTLGSGRVGSAIGRAWVKAGHEVMFSSIDLEADKKLAASIGKGAYAGTPREAAAFGTVVLVSVPYAAMPAIGRDLGDLLKGKVIIDTSNPIVARDGDLAVAARGLTDGLAGMRIPVDRTDEIGDLAKSFAGMQKQLLTDRLTGIANRESVVRRIEDRIVRQRRRGDSHPFAVLFVDLNRFKTINDQYGHETGDAVLAEIARRLVASVREDDMAARFGGDEFVVLLDNVANRVDAMSARDKLERVLAAPLQALQGIAKESPLPSIGGAIGVAISPDDGHDLETLLKRADYDMYQRKQAVGSKAS